MQFESIFEAGFVKKMQAWWFHVEVFLAKDVRKAAEMCRTII
jgi:hypothetical protein